MKKNYKPRKDVQPLKGGRTFKVNYPEHWGLKAEDRIIFRETKDGYYWRAEDENGNQVYKNGKPQYGGWPKFAVETVYVLPNGERAFLEL